MSRFVVLIAVCICITMVGCGKKADDHGAATESDVRSAQEEPNQSDVHKKSGNNLADFFHTSTGQIGYESPDVLIKGLLETLAGDNIDILLHFLPEDGRDGLYVNEGRISDGKSTSIDATLLLKILRRCAEFLDDKSKEHFSRSRPYTIQLRSYRYDGTYENVYEHHSSFDDFASSYRSHLNMENVEIFRANYRGFGVYLKDDLWCLDLDDLFQDGEVPGFREAAWGFVEGELTKLQPSDEHKEALQNAANNLKAWALVFALYVENGAQKMPTLKIEKGLLLPAMEELYPEYLTNPGLLLTPNHEAQLKSDLASDKISMEVALASSDYFYVGYDVRTPEDARCLLDLARKAISQGLDALRPEFVENQSNCLISPLDVDNRPFRGRRSNSSGEATNSSVPVLVEDPSTWNDRGGHVLFLDGSVQFMDYPGEFPMTHEFVEGLRGLRKSSR